MKERGVLLLHGDQAYLWFLEPSTGRVLALDTDDVRQRLEPETSPSAVLNAARARPELRELLPRRPGRAHPCERCEGAGEVEGWSACACAGLGWVT